MPYAVSVTDNLGASRSRTDKGKNNEDRRDIRLSGLRAVLPCAPDSARKALDRYKMESACEERREWATMGS